MLVRARHLFSLSLMLLFASFAMADSIPVGAVSHSSLGSLTANRSAAAFQKNPSSSMIAAASFGSTQAAPAGFHVADRNATGSTSFLQTRAFSPNQFSEVHGTISYPAPGWRVWRHQPTAAPEPSSFLLVSSGIFGIAGLVRRKVGARSA
jgi:hypothetical protein